MGDDEGGAALHQVAEAGLDHGLGFGVQGAGGLVEDEDARVGKDGAGDGEALALAAGELDAALADDSVVLLGEAFGEFVYAGDAAGFQSCSSVALGRENRMFSRMVPSKRKVSCSTTPNCWR